MRLRYRSILCVWKLPQNIYQRRGILSLLEFSKQGSFFAYDSEGMAKRAKEEKPAHQQQRRVLANAVGDSGERLWFRQRCESIQHKSKSIEITQPQLVSIIRKQERIVLTVYRAKSHRDVCDGLGFIHIFCHAREEESSHAARERASVPLTTTCGRGYVWHPPRYLLFCFQFFWLIFFVHVGNLFPVHGKLLRISNLLFRL